MSEPKTPPSFRRYRSLFWPVVLILLGIVFLLNNLGLLSGNLGRVIVNLWPVLLIIVGLDNFVRWRSLTGPLILVGLGFVFLLGNLGGLSASPWETLGQLWPLLVITLGLEMLIRRQKWLSWLVFIGLLGLFSLLLGMTGNLKILG